MAAPSSGGSERDRYILWIGRSDSTKNLPAVLAAFRKIERQLDVRLVIAGEGSDTGARASGQAGGRIMSGSSMERDNYGSDRSSGSSESSSRWESEE